jgi:hypothetical protein
MSLWMSEKEFRQSDAQSLGVTINVAFLQEIKQDSEFRQTLTEVHARINAPEPVPPRTASELLGDLRDQLETYFALEEFYGYFKNSAESNPTVSQAASSLRQDHERLFLQFSDLVECSEQIVYRECSKEVTVKQLAEKLDEFCHALAKHEHDEMELMMRMCNEDIGVGD